MSLSQGGFFPSTQLDNSSHEERLAGCSVISDNFPDGKLSGRARGPLSPGWVSRHISVRDCSGSQDVEARPLPRSSDGFQLPAPLTTRPLPGVEIKSISYWPDMKVITFELHLLLSGTKLDMRYWSWLVSGSTISVVFSTLAWIIFMWKFRMSDRMLFSTLAKCDSTKMTFTRRR